MVEKRKISLVLADVDGTLVTEEKVLTQRAQKAVSALQKRWHSFCNNKRSAAARHGHAV
jgi:ribonucleotide monophosphatase NagD (HAD superfamily)